MHEASPYDFTAILGVLGIFIIFHSHSSKKGTIKDVD